ncbi:MAG: smrA [Rickettsiaceae bacterium]|jgi:DNA-nicking Smr family endonuclease|nr:smrA [Rickettsiaceae bacterium]
MKDDDILSDDDQMVWHYVTQSVEPLPGKEVIISEPLQKTPKEKKVEMVDIGRLLHKTEPVPEKKANLNYITHGKNIGVDKATAKRLTGGKFPIQARLDLHGMTQDKALLELRNFISSCYEQGKRNVLIITGKGPGNDGVLKNQVPRWLNVEGVREYTLMFSYAQVKHGGEGALYVLLKRKKS